MGHTGRNITRTTVTLLCVVSSPYHDLLAFTLRWRHNGRDGFSNHQPYDCLLNRLFRHRSKKTSKLRVTGLCAGNSPGTGEFPAQRASNAKNVSNWWRHHDFVVPNEFMLIGSSFQQLCICISVLGPKYNLIDGILKYMVMTEIFWLNSIEVCC